MSNMRDVMDTSKLFTIIYSGVENDRYYKILYDLGIRSFLMSYHYIQGKSIDIKQRFEGQDVRLFIDSGAHTYQNNAEYEDYSVEYWEEHLKKYLQWVKNHKEYIFAIANFDFENLVGGDVVDRWNKEYFEPFMIESNIPVCFVWHDNSALSWDMYCERYPYVGFSGINTNGVSLDFTAYFAKLKTAEKYNSLCHGYGMTKTAILPKLPFYSSDSTTWLVGLQYGEINFWTGKKMTRLKKDKWKGEYLDKIEALGINRKLLLDEDTDEMVKANIIAFMEAEKYIRTHLHIRMYWLKPAVAKPKSLVEVKFPSLEWCEGKTEFDKPEAYAKDLNINPEAEGVMDIVLDCTLFIKRKEEGYNQLFLKDYLKDETTIKNLYNFYLNSMCEDDDARIEELTSFFTDVVMGENDKLFFKGTTFDRVVKERESYMMEETHDIIDLTEEEVKESLKNLLPENTTDPIDLMDEEIFKGTDIIPVRDEGGKFIKGQKSVHRPKQMYSEKYPKLACDRCYSAATCPEFKAGYVCAYSKMFKRFDTRNMTDIIEAIQGIIAMNLERMQRAMIFETLDSGVPDGTLTAMIDQNIRLLTTLKNLYDNSSSQILRQTTTLKADGSCEQETKVTNPQQGSIIEQLFKNRLGKDSFEPEPEPKKEVENSVISNKDIIDINNIIEVKGEKNE